MLLYYPEPAALTGFKCDLFELCERTRNDGSSFTNAKLLHLYYNRNSAIFTMCVVLFDVGFYLQVVLTSTELHNYCKVTPDFINDIK